MQEYRMRPAECLGGLDLQGGWHVEEVVHRPPTATGGRFSVGYRVRHNEGQKGYLKALDFADALQQPDTMSALAEMSSAYVFERELLYRCQDRRLRRVVTPLASGEVEVSGNFGPSSINKVYYLIFELATGDIRAEISRWSQFDVAWSLRSLHHAATGLQQLHSVGIAHQDLKPSNVLVFRNEGSKIADLGRASLREHPSRIDSLLIPGDLGYSPPEQFYGWRSADDFSPRFLADLYLLGSLVFFYFLSCSATQITQAKLAVKGQGGLTGNRFMEDLPYIQHAFAEALVDLEKTAGEVAGDLADEIVMIAEQLCEPDPRRRGDPRVRRTISPQHDLQPYISRFDRLARRAELRLI